MISNYEHNRLGRIWVVWTSDTKLTPMFKSEQMITCSVLLPGRTEEFLCSFVYASNSCEERKLLWDEIRQHHDSPIFRNKPWMLCGDFNEILESSEHSNYVDNSQNTTGMRDFMEVVRYCSLMDLGYHGPLYTWCNKREDGLICKKLDRVLVNTSWTNDLPNSYSVFEAGGCSDHTRGRISLDTVVRGGRKPFKFSNVLTTMPEFLPTVAENWGNTRPLFVSTSAIFRLGKKLKALKPAMRVLSREKLSDLSRRTKDAYNDLCTKQKDNLINPTEATMEAETNAFKIWQRLADIEEKYMQQRAKLHWLAVGDRNNAYFIRSAEMRRMKNTISEIIGQNGITLKTQEEIKSEAVRFFEDFYNIVPDNLEIIQTSTLQELLSFRCTEQDRRMLVREVTKEEIQKVIFDMPSNKSPGPDGYTSEFFQRAWNIVGQDVVAAIQSFFVKGFLPKGQNATILALIPKTGEARTMSNYRPISCCNLIYKVISKIIANRFKNILPWFINLNQSAFIQQRLLMENVLLAMEMVKDYHKENISPRCAMKIDISKAFDSVQWEFVLNILSAIKFPEEFIHWIRLCITTPFYSVQVNGELAGFFGSKRGLRQGCALSPYIFVMCMNVLSCLIDKAAAAKIIGYHPKCKNIRMTHLCFADDLLVFVDGTQRSIEGTLAIFGDFERMSGLKISMEKSTLYMAGIREEQRDNIISRFPFSVGVLPVKYLGLPLLTKSMSTQDYKPLVELIRSKVSSWTARYLSYAGRLQLLQSVIRSITNFWLSAFRLPGGCIEEIEKVCAAFLWSGPELKTKKSKVAWSEVCNPKAEGGLGLRLLKDVNHVSCLHLIWRIVSHKPSLWVNYIRTTLIGKDSFWSIKESTTKGSWMWRKILKYRDMAKGFHKVKIGRGDTTSFWFDDWCEMGCLYQKTGPRGTIDLGIPINTTLYDVFENHRRRGHQIEQLNTMEDAIAKARVTRKKDVDISYWKHSENVFKTIFNTSNTWNLLRNSQQIKHWYKGIWFSNATPKYSFFSWLAIKNRLTTCDRMRGWSSNLNDECILCRWTQETRDHLFFLCRYSKEVWRNISFKILGTEYTPIWNQVITILTSNRNKDDLFLLRYAFQASVYHIWRERNQRRHGEVGRPATTLAKIIDKNVINRINTISNNGLQPCRKMMERWLETRLYL